METKNIEQTIDRSMSQTDQAIAIAQDALAMAQKLQEQRDELLAAVRTTCDQGGAVTSHQLISFRQMLKKYPKP